MPFCGLSVTKECVLFIYWDTLKIIWDRDNSVGIATGYGLYGPGIESRWGARFIAHVQTSPGAHPASCTVGTGSFPGAKWPGRGGDHPPLLAPRSRMSRAIPLLPLWPVGACYRVNFTLQIVNTAHAINLFKKKVTCRRSSLSRSTGFMT
jgi:hypothetical protein